MPLTAPGAIATRIAPDGDAVAVRVGVIDGMATAALKRDELLSARVRPTQGSARWSCSTVSAQLPLIGSRLVERPQLRLIDIPFTDGNLIARVGSRRQRIPSPSA